MWYSQSQKKLCPVRVTKISEKSKVVVVTFEENSAVWKSVPFSMLGQPDCPLRNKPQHAKRPQASSASDAVPTSRPRSRSGTRTPDWKEIEKQRLAKQRQAEVIQQAEIDKAIAAEEERLKQEQKRKEMLDAEKRKVQAAFEKRKKEAEEQALREEEEWRSKLRAERELEAAICEAQ